MVYLQTYGVQLTEGGEGMHDPTLLCAHHTTAGKLGSDPIIL